MPADAQKEVGRLLKRSSRPGAIFSAHIWCTLGTLRAIRTAGLSVPREIEVVGFDDLALADLITYPVTTIAQDVEGEKAPPELVLPLKRPRSKRANEPSFCVDPRRRKGFTRPSRRSRLDGHMQGLRAIVTGGAGFIGSNLVLELERRYGAKVVVIDNFLTGNFRNLDGFKGDLIAEDVENPAWCRKLDGRKFDAIFHLASITDTTIHDQRKMMSNVEGMRVILEFARAREIPVVYASSAAVYGNGPAPNRESQTPQPANIYGFSKLIMENLAAEYARHVRVVGLRYFNVYGPRESFKGAAASMVYQLARQIQSGKRPRIFKFGEHKRDFVYVKDVVDLTIAALRSPESTVLNIGTGRATTFNEVIAALNTALGTNYEPDYFDNPYTAFYQNHTEADTSRLKTLLGVSARYDINTGVKDYMSLLTNHR